MNIDFPFYRCDLSLSGMAQAHTSVSAAILVNNEDFSDPLPKNYAIRISREGYLAFTFIISAQVILPLDKYWPRHLVLIYQGK